MLRPCAAGVGEEEANSISDLEVRAGRADDGLDWKREREDPGGGTQQGPGGQEGGCLSPRHPGALWASLPADATPAWAVGPSRQELIRQEVPQPERPLKSHHCSFIPWVEHCLLSDGRSYYALNFSYSALKTQITYNLISGAAFWGPSRQNKLFPPL